MKNLDNLDKILAFTTVSDLISNRSPVDNNAKARIEQVKNSFEEIVAGMNSIVKKKGPYVLVDNLKEILEATGHYFDKPKSRQKLQFNETIKEFLGYVNRLNLLEENPEEFHAEEDFKRKRLLYTCKLIGDFYQRDLNEEMDKRNPHFY